MHSTPTRSPSPANPVADLHRRLAQLPPASSATAEDVEMIADHVEVVGIDLEIVAVGDQLAGLGAADLPLAARAERRAWAMERRALRRWLTRARGALVSRPARATLPSAPAPRPARRETRSRPSTTTDPPGEDPDPPPGGLRPPDDPRESQRSPACPACGSPDHWHRRTSGPLHYDCVASLGRTAVVRLRGAAAPRTG